MKSSRIISTKPGTLLLRSVLVGMIGGAASCALLLLLAAAVIQSGGKLPQQFLQPLILIICSISAFLSGFLASKIGRRRGLLTGAVCGLLLFLLCLIGGIVNTHDVFSISALTRLLVMMLAGALGGYLGMYQRRKV
ncbi:MAG: TIGR04086 family membrane protein [Oscillospiraceae bacterium]|nr:TIGR04086 family membrane protein [Oscillospiraceae bacterium]MDD3261497.1 TIGR04086 family membrane protein [Oscillospiraceae bacterium]